VAIGTLTVLPIYVLGMYNDLAQRASIPGLFLFWMVLLRTFAEGRISLGNCRGRVLVGCLILGAVAPAYTWLKNVHATRPWLQYFEGRADVTFRDIPEDILPQYLGRADSFFFQSVAGVGTNPAIDPDIATVKHASEESASGAPTTFQYKHSLR
jgi:hypothetical protein